MEREKEREREREISTIIIIIICICIYIYIYIERERERDVNGLRRGGGATVGEGVHAIAASASRGGVGNRCLNQSNNTQTNTYESTTA